MSSNTSITATNYFYKILRVIAPGLARWPCTYLEIRVKLCLVEIKEFKMPLSRTSFYRI